MGKLIEWLDEKYPRYEVRAEIYGVYGNDNAWVSVGSYHGYFLKGHAQNYANWLGLKPIPNVRYRVVKL